MFLNREFYYFLKNNKGNKKVHDPTNPKIGNLRSKPGTKFIKSSEYKIYKRELL